MDATVKLALDEVNINLTRVLETLEDVPPEAFANPQDRYSLGELIARAGGIVASELHKGDAPTRLGPCTFPDYSREE